MLHKITEKTYEYIESLSTHIFVCGLENMSAGGFRRDMSNEK
jgi:hypothetical protein